MRNDSHYSYSYIIIDNKLTYLTYFFQIDFLEVFISIYMLFSAGKKNLR